MMKQAIDEIPMSRRALLDPMLLLAFALGAIVSTILLVAVGPGRRAIESPIHSGLLSRVEVQIDSNSRGSNTYTEGEKVQGRLFENYLIVDGPGPIEVIPARRLIEARFHR